MHDRHGMGCRQCASYMSARHSLHKHFQHTLRDTHATFTADKHVLLLLHMRAGPPICTYVPVAGTPGSSSPCHSGTDPLAALIVGVHAGWHTLPPQRHERLLLTRVKLAQLQAQSSAVGEWVRLMHASAGSAGWNHENPACPSSPLPTPRCRINFPHHFCVQFGPVGGNAQAGQRLIEHGTFGIAFVLQRCHCQRQVHVLKILQHMREQLLRDLFLNMAERGGWGSMPHLLLFFHFLIVDMCVGNNANGAIRNPPHTC